MFVGGWALAQLWLFWVAPIVGAIARRGRLSDHRGAGRQPGAAGYRHPEVTGCELGNLCLRGRVGCWGSWPRSRSRPECTLTASPALSQTSKPGSYSLLDTIGESMFGDVYAEPSRWQPLSAGGFFAEGWNRPWVSPPAGEGGAPRQGWLNAFDGVFYRLGVVTGGLAHDFHDNGNQYTAGLTLYTPLSVAVRGEARRAVRVLEPGRDGQ